MVLLYDLTKCALFLHNKHVGLWNCCKLKKRSHSVLGALLPGVMFSVFVASHSPTLWTHPYQMKPRTGRTLKSDDYQYVVDVNDPEAVVGYVLGCISAIFYIMSRVPQIVKNVRTTLCKVYMVYVM